MSSEQQKTIGLMLFLAILLAAVVTRYFGLGDWAFEGDEYFTAFDAHNRYKSLTSNPVYYALVVASYDLFGMSEWSARFPAFIFGVAGILVFFHYGRALFGRYESWFGAGLILISSWHLWYSQSARFYSGVFLFGFLSFLLFHEALVRRSVMLLLMAFVANSVVVLMHQSAVLVPITCAVFGLVVVMRHATGQAGQYDNRLAAVYVAVLGILALLATPYLIGRALSWSGKGEAWGYAPFEFGLQLIKYLQLSVAAAAFMGWLLLLRKNRMTAIFIGLAIAMPILLLLVGSAFVPVRPDYMFYSVPLVYGLAGVLCEEFRKKFPGQLASFGLFVVIVSSMLPEMVSHYTGKRSLDFREVVEFVEQQYVPGDHILSLKNGFSNYASRTYPMEPYPGNPYDNSIDWQQVLTKSSASAGRLWIILPLQRNPLANGLEQWLLSNAQLMWRKQAKRLDYTVDGYQIFLVKRQI